MATSGAISNSISRSWRRAWSWLACGLGLAGLLNNNLPGQDAAPSEYQVKAVWLLNFARFVEWPTNTFSDPKAPFVVGLVGKDPFGDALEKAFGGKTFQGRPFSFRRVSNDADMRGCQVLFIPSSDKRRIRDLADKLKGAPVLTVGESDDFLDFGGIINFILKEGSVRFEINVKAAQAAGLKLNANLLKVATSVRGRYD